MVGVVIRGEWFRCVSLGRDPLSAEGARLLGGRLNCPGDAALYLASTPTLAVAENLQLANIYGVLRFPPRLLVTVDVTLENVIDLKSDDSLATFGLTTKELFGEWRGDIGAPTPSQILGRSLATRGLEGAILPSAIESGSANLVVFVRNVDLAIAVHVLGRE